MTRVLVVDDHPTFRDGVRAVLSRAPGIEIAGECGSGEELLEQCAADPPDVVVLDLLMPGMGGLEAARRLSVRHPDVAVLVVTMSDADESVYAALRAGAAGYVLKEAPGTQIVDAVRLVAEGQAVFGAPVARRISAFFAGSAAPPRPFPELTDRERQVLELLARGLDNGEIAERLSVSRKTVRNVVSTVLGKLQVATRAEAVARGRDAGLGSPPV
ncbi:response regulator [Blastococcus sp. SYSU DS0973]